LQLSALFAKYLNFSFLQHRDAAWPLMSRSPKGRDMMKRSHIFSLVAAASFVVTWPVVWFVLDVDLHLKKASATTSTPCHPTP